MSDYLNAECVFNALFTKEVFKRKLWKLKNITKDRYDVTFELTGEAKIAGFVVYIRGSYHYIGVTALVNQSKRFKIQIDDILVQCSIAT